MNVIKRLQHFAKLQPDAGTEDDLKRATRIARKMVANWGMSERLGPIAFRVDETHSFLGREAEKKAFDVLTEERDLLDKLTAALELH